MSLITTVQNRLGDRVVLPETAPAGLSVVQPRSLEAAAELVKLAGRENWKLIAIGSGSKLHWTTPPAGNALYMDMRLCSQVVEYAPGDMTITVEAGITLAALADALARQRQRVTLDPPHAASATIGGVLASNDSGPVRYAYGIARDVVIGMSMIQPDGETIHSGGKVVKNVAGYDLHKLYIGSFGTMGPMATVTFRLRPLPESRGGVMLDPRDAEEAERLIAAVLAGPTRPTYIELLNAEMAKAIDVGTGMTLAIGYEENAEAVAWQCDQVTALLGGDRLTDRYATQVYDKLREAAALSSAVCFKATMLSSKTAAFIERFSRLPLKMIARAANGIVHGLASEPLPESAWRDIENAVAEGQGSLQIRGPVPAGMNRFGSPRNDASLSKAVRSAFDPQDRFAAARAGL